MLEPLKREVIAAAQWAEELGLVRHRVGNFSARDHKSGLVVMTPSGVERKTMQPEDVIVMDMGGNIHECREGLKPTSEWRVHLAAYEERPDAAAVVHTHSRWATVFAVLRQRIMPIMTEMAMLNLKEWYIPVAPFAKIASPELGEAVRKPLSISDVVLLAGHGVLVVNAASINEAVLRAAYVEDIAKVYYHARMLTGGVEPPLLPRFQLNH